MRKVSLLPEAKRDQHGQPLPSGPAREARVEGVWPASTTETVVDAETRTDDLIMVTHRKDRPLDTDVVLYLGGRYQIVGVVQALEDEGRIEGWQARLRKVKG